MAEKRKLFQEVSGDAKPQAATPGVISAGGGANHKTLRTWLWMMIVLIIVMVVVGGLTRLTDSGLSITEWNPVMGAIPPLSAADWDAAFAAYKTTSEYELQNQGMSLGEFQFIFWWEWGHRQLGRFIGVIWLLGFLGLWLFKMIPNNRRKAMFLIGPFIGVQGVIGWLMVASGLQGTRTDVAAYWLMAHLGAAFALLGYIYWQAIMIGRTQADLFTAQRKGDVWLTRMTRVLIVMVFVQILLGGLVAGLDAGRNYTDWPLMAGGFLPPDILGMTPWWRNLYENDGLVQFAHRMNAYALFAFAILVGLRAARSAMKTTRKLFARVGMILTLQMILGVVTVMMSSPWYLAIAHQFLAILLWLMLIRGRQLARYPVGSVIRG